MATGDSQETYESWLNQATDPSNQEDRWDCIQGFYKLVNQETDGPQIAIRLLAHKIQSPQEKEALQALTVLEACMNNCGKRFHNEAAKFRFLNELIKILTPKYYGAWTAQTVKDRVTEVLYGWTLWLKEESKIHEAYRMLKKQGIIKKDPKLPDRVIMAPPPQRSTDSVFDQEEKAKLLARLLKSQRLEDLETANRIIKSTVKEEQEKAEKMSKRESTLKEVESSSKQLREMLELHAITGTLSQPSEELKAIYERCDRLRPSLFRLASDTVDDDAALVQILAANDELTLAVNVYKERVGRGVCNGRRESGEMTDKSNAPTSPREIKSYHLIDLSALDSPQTHRKADSPPFLESFSPLFSSHLESAFQSAAEQEFTEFELHNLDAKRSHTQETPKSYYDELMQFNGEVQITNAEQCGGRGPVLRARGCEGNSASQNGMGYANGIWSLSPDEQFTSLGSLLKSQKHPNEVSGSPAKSEGGSCPSQLLKNIFIPMETIKSSHLEPITLYHQGGIHASLHFAKDSPLGQPSVAVVVISTVNTSAFTVRDFLFQAAVPKTMSVKLQPASGTQLPPYNPLLPPPAISQVLLLANPQKRNVRLRYKLKLIRGDQQLNETGEVDNFPDWTSMIGH